ncbi:hypothetical protein ABTX62_03300 [Streptomyces sp. NPDC096046]|uniref:hypothetical protein n=1 Tax=Streptomyces sp. NPDC096046 TaxID=3155542 RepID=UPI00332BCFA5
MARWRALGGASATRSRRTAQALTAAPAPGHNRPARRGRRPYRLVRRGRLPSFTGVFTREGEVLRFVVHAAGAQLPDPGLAPGPGLPGHLEAR